MKRLLIDLAILASVIYLPFYIYLPLILLGIIFVPFFWEAIIFALVVDFFYGPKLSPGSLFSYPFALVAALLVLALIPLRARLRLHA